MTSACPSPTSTSPFAGVGRLTNTKVETCLQGPGSISTNFRSTASLTSTAVEPCASTAPAQIPTASHYTSNVLQQELNLIIDIPSSLRPLGPHSGGPDQIRARLGIEGGTIIGTAEFLDLEPGSAQITLHFRA